MQKISSEISKALGRLFMERYKEASNDESSSCKSKKFLSRIHQSFPIPLFMPALHSLPCEHRKKVVKKWKPHCNGKMKKNSLATRKSRKSGKNEKQHVLRANNDTVLMHILPYVCKRSKKKANVCKDKRKCDFGTPHMRQDFSSS